MTRKSRVVATFVAAALALAACNGEGDEPEGNGIDDIEVPDDSPGAGGDGDGTPGDDDSDGSGADDPNGNDASDDPQDGPEGNGDGNGENGSGDEDPFAVPDEIDIDYVQSVFDELTRIDSEHIRSMIERPAPSAVEASDTQTIEAIYGGPLLDVRRDEVVSFLFDDDSRDGFISEVGHHSFDVLEIAEVYDDCITAVGWWDITEIAENPFEEDLYAAWVIQRSSEVDVAINKTEWVFWDRNPLIRGEDSEPFQPDEWGELDLESVLDLQCASGG